MESRSFNLAASAAGWRNVRLVESHGCHIDEQVEDSHYLVWGTRTGDAR